MIQQTNDIMIQKTCTFDRISAMFLSFSVNSCSRLKKNFADTFRKIDGTSRLQKPESFLKLFEKWMETLVCTDLKKKMMGTGKVLFKHLKLNYDLPSSRLQSFVFTNTNNNFHDMFLKYILKDFLKLNILNSWGLPIH